MLFSVSLRKQKEELTLVENSGPDVTSDPFCELTQVTFIRLSGRIFIPTWRWKNWDEDGKGHKASEFGDRNQLRLASQEPYWWPQNCKYTIQLFLINLQSCITTTPLRVRTFPSPQKVPFALLGPLPPASPLLVVSLPDLLPVSMHLPFLDILCK